MDFPIIAIGKMEHITSDNPLQPPEEIRVELKIQLTMRVKHREMQLCSRRKS